MAGHGKEAMEVAKTVLEVADVAWNAIELRHLYKKEQETLSGLDDDLESLRSENRRLRNLLQNNIKLLQDLSLDPKTPDNCPHDLYPRLEETVSSNKFLTQLQSLHQEAVDGTVYGFPFKEATDADLHTSEVLINVDQQEPSWWVWVSDDIVPSTIEEWSGIDDENYLIVSEEHVVDGVANFMARCMLSNPKAQNLTPEELQKTLAKALDDGISNKFDKMLHIWHAGKLFYSLSTWGLTIAGLYHNRRILKLAAKGIHTTSKVVLKAI